MVAKEVEKYYQAEARRSTVKGRARVAPTAKRGQQATTAKRGVKGFSSQRLENNYEITGNGKVVKLPQQLSFTQQLRAGVQELLNQWDITHIATVRPRKTKITTINAEHKCDKALVESQGAIQELFWAIEGDYDMQSNHMHLLFKANEDMPVQKLAKLLGYNPVEVPYLERIIDKESAIIYCSKQIGKSDLIRGYSFSTVDTAADNIYGQWDASQERKKTQIKYDKSKKRIEDIEAFRDRLEEIKRIDSMQPKQIPHPNESKHRLQRILSSIMYGWKSNTVA